jgi:hypothetical protein
MKSAPRTIDRNPSQLLLWLSYLDEAGRSLPLPAHTLVTSRGDGSRRAHYALICESDERIGSETDLGVIDAACARNLRTLNPIGASQVTAVVAYRCDTSHAPARPYRVSFRARLNGQGFVRLASPVQLTATLRSLYDDACRATAVAEWCTRVAAVKDLAREQIAKTRFATGELFA